MADLLVFPEGAALMGGVCMTASHARVTRARTSDMGKHLRCLRNGGFARFFQKGAALMGGV
jgi:hypothetical protein